MKIDRAFFAGQKGCNNGCRYCFSYWNCPPSLVTMPCSLQSKGSVIIYPICDSELNQQDDNFGLRLENCLENNPKCVLSISTKEEWSDASLDRIDAIRRKMGGLRIKLSVSIACKSMIKELEPRASDYDSRIRLLQRLEERGICHSVMLKPLLPFISSNEYCEIVNDTSAFCKDFVIGDLYVDQTTPFFKKYISEKYKVERRYCEWMQRDVDYVAHPQEKDIVCYMRINNLSCYFSDADFLHKQIEGFYHD